MELPTARAEIPDAINPRGIHFVGDMGILVRDRQVVVHDMRALDQPGRAVTHSLGDREGYGVESIGNTVYVATADRIDVYTLSGTRLRARTRVPLPSTGPRTMVRSGALLLVLGQHGLDLLDASTPTRPTLVASHPVEWGASLAVRDGLAYVYGFHRLTVIDVHDPRRPQTTSETPIPESRPPLDGRLVFDPGGRLLLGSGRAVIAYDVSRPSAPREVARTRLPLGVRGGMLVEGRHVLVGTGTALEVLEYAGADLPLRVLTVVAIEAPTMTLAARDGLLYVSGRIYDPRDFDVSPRVVSMGGASAPAPAAHAASATATASIPDARDSVRLAGHEWVASPAGIDTVDGAGRRVGHLALPLGVERLFFVHEGRLFAGSPPSPDDGYARLSEIDVRDPSNPQILSAESLSRSITDVLVSGENLLVVSDLHYGVTMVHAPAGGYLATVGHLPVERLGATAAIQEGRLVADGVTWELCRGT
ncbi:MAG: hypothetical protein AB7S26_07375 [Sandaracinaceae bacterium]